MNVSANALRKDTIATLRQLEAVENEIRADAQDRNISPSRMRDANGNWVMIPLLSAKAQCLYVIASLRGQ